jgi:NAD(P)-dependent dehydrogenase (short-subunit alcohol dehydrogenase family)
MSVIVITGGSRGIGASAAKHIAQRGMGVILTYNSHPEAAASVVERIEHAGGKAVALKLDVADVAEFLRVSRVSDICLARDLGPHLPQWPGQQCRVWSVQTLGQRQRSAVRRLFNVHLKGPFFLTQTLLPLLADGASIVNLTSATTRVATAGVAPYAAFKGGLEVLTRCMAKEFGERRIRANAVSPGAIRTELGGGE